MEILANLLFFVHLVALVGAGASAVAMPVIVKVMGGAGGEGRQTALSIAAGLRRSNRGALVLLLITGPLLFWLKWDFSAPSMAWFGIKMLLVLLIVVLAGVSDMSQKKARAGDAAAAKRSRLAGQAMGVTLIGVILAAVFAFN